MVNIEVGTKIRHSNFDRLIVPILLFAVIMCHPHNMQMISFRFYVQVHYELRLHHLQQQPGNPIQRLPWDVGLRRASPSAEPARPWRQWREHHPSDSRRRRRVRHFAVTLLSPWV